MRDRARRFNNDVDNDDDVNDNDVNNNNVNNNNVNNDDSSNDDDDVDDVPSNLKTYNCKSIYSFKSILCIFEQKYCPFPASLIHFWSLQATVQFWEIHFYICKCRDFNS